MVTALFDTNILIDALNRVPDARVEIARFDVAAISVVSWMEVMVGAEPENDAVTRDLLAGFRLVEIDTTVMERAVELRRGYRIKLPDAVIWATAQIHEMVLVTRNTKDFPADHSGVRVPYTL